jgi:hypothetical protein
MPSREGIVLSKRYLPRKKPYPPRAVYGKLERPAADEAVKDHLVRGSFVRKVGAAEGVVGCSIVLERFEDGADLVGHCDEALTRFDDHGRVLGRRLRFRRGQRSTATSPCAGPRQQGPGELGGADLCLLVDALRRRIDL